MDRDENVFKDGALLTARVALGASIAAHGAQKLFGWFGGPGADAASNMMETLGFKPGRTYATLASGTELTSGLLITLGLGGPLGPAMLASVMTVAAGSVHVKNGYFNTNQGFELNTIYTVAAILLAMQDYGRLSLDHAIGLRKLNVPPLVCAGAVAGAVATGLALLARREKELTLLPATHRGASTIVLVSAPV